MSKQQCIINQVNYSIMCPLVVRSGNSGYVSTSEAQGGVALHRQGNPAETEL